MAAQYQGIDAENGKALSGISHLQQSIRDILTTRVGTRVMRREYGSDLPNLVDNPLNDATKLDLFAEVAIALQKWEPRVVVDRVFVESVSDAGRIVIGLEGRNLIDGQLVKLEGIVL